MGNSIIYRTLFEVRLLHHYFLNKGSEVYDTIAKETDKLKLLSKYDISEFLEIEPTETCKKLLKKHRCIFKRIPTGFLVGISCIKKDDGSFVPVHKPNDDCCFSFLVNYTDSFFINYTSLPLKRKISDLDKLIEQAGNLIYYCQNKTTGSPKKAPFLTKMAPVFKAGQKYSAGEILTDNDTAATKLFIAKKITTQSPPGTDWTDDMQVNGNPLQYAGINDLHPVFNNLIRFDTRKATTDPTVTVINSLNKTIPVKTELIKDKADSVNETVVVLTDIHFLDEGVYKIKYKDAAASLDKEFFFYRLQKTIVPDMVIDITAKSDDSDFSLFNTAGALKESTFEIRFRNRETQWQYKGANFSDNSVTGPLPLTKNGYINPTVKNKNNVNVTDLPNPSVKMIKASYPDNNSNVYNTISEIFIH
jgi:hypothetical protein